MRCAVLKHFLQFFYSFHIAEDNQNTTNRQCGFDTTILVDKCDRIRIRSLSNRCGPGIVLILWM